MFKIKYQGAADSSAALFCFILTHMEPYTNVAIIAVAVAFVVLALMGIVFLAYVIAIVRKVFNITSTVQMKTQALGDDAQETFKTIISYLPKVLPALLPLIAAGIFKAMKRKKK